MVDGSAHAWGRCRDPLCALRQPGGTPNLPQYNKGYNHGRKVASIGADAFKPRSVWIEIPGAIRDMPLQTERKSGESEPKVTVPLPLSGYLLTIKTLYEDSGCHDKRREQVIPRKITKWAVNQGWDSNKDIPGWAETLGAARWVGWSFDSGIKKVVGDKQICGPIHSIVDTRIHKTNPYPRESIFIYHADVKDSC